MINEKFINTYTNTQTAVPVFTPQNTIQNDMEKLHRFKEKHCLPHDNRHPNITSFIQAAKAVGFDAYTVENYIYNNIHIAADSSKNESGAVKKLIDDLYNRYPQKLISLYKTKPQVVYHNDYSNNNPDTLLRKYSNYRITSLSNYPIPTPVITINNEAIASEGNIMAISGLQKSGKSSFCNIILAGCFGVPLDGVPETINISASNDKAVIHIDTEQAKHRQLYNIKNSILKRAGLQKEPDYFYSYNIRGMEMQDAIEMLNAVFYAADAKHGGIHLVLIDGIADFITSVNDEEQSNQIVKQLEYLATKYKTLIIAVIHRNPNDSKVRGHIGSQLLRKCEAVLALKTDGDNSYLEPDELRTAAKGDIPKYLFAYNKDKGYHVCIGVAEIETKIDREQKIQNLVDTLTDGIGYARKDLVKMVCEAMGVKEEMAQKIVKRMADNFFIEPMPNKKGFWVKANTNPFVEQKILAFDSVIE